jgi:hypothetical protein
MVKFRHVVHVKVVEIVLLQSWNTSDSTTCHFITPMRALRFIWSSWPFRMKAIHPFETSVCTHSATRCHPRSAESSKALFHWSIVPTVSLHAWYNVHNIFPLDFRILFHAASWPLSCWRTLSLLFVKLGHRRCRSWSFGGAGEGACLNIP